MIFLLHHAPLVIPSVSPSGLFMPAEKFYSCFMETFSIITLIINTLCFVPFQDFRKTGIKMEHLSRFGRRLGKHFVPLPAQKLARITAAEQQTLSHCRIILFSHSCSPNTPKMTIPLENFLCRLTNLCPEKMLKSQPTAFLQDCT